MKSQAQKNDYIAPAIGRDVSDLRSDMKASVTDGAAFSLMVGLGETYIPAFAMAVGLGEINAGLIATLPLLAGACLQLVSPTMVRVFKSYRRWVLLCATIQGAAFLPLFIAALVGYLPVSAAFLIAAIYWGAGMGAGAAWNCWIATLIPTRIRPAFFARRNRVTQIASLAGFLMGGLILRWVPSGTRAMWAFALLFIAAFACRMYSVSWLARQSEPVQPPSPSKHTLPFAELAAIFARGDGGGRLLLYMLSVQLTVQVAAPFFTPYMLGILKFDYSRYAALVAASFAAKVLTLPWLGKFAKLRGAPSLIWLGGVGIAIVPAFWLVSGGFWYLLAIQAITGFFWAAYELATVLLMLERIGEKERVGVLTSYNLLNASLVATGSLLGAAVLESIGSSHHAYLIVFFVSSLARIGTLFGLRRVAGRQSTWVTFGLPNLELRVTDGLVSPLNAVFRSWLGVGRTHLADPLRVIKRGRRPKKTASESPTKKAA